MSSRYLDALFSPRSVALVGASEGSASVGSVVFENLLSGGFKGQIIPVNLKRKIVRGRRCYASLRKIGRPVDLAVIATPAATVPGILEDCAASGVRAAVIMSAGFAEAGKAGARLQERVIAIARRHGIRIVGPNCLGLMRPEIGLNATFSKSNARPGGVALVSQSGALCTAILDWADVHGVGFSAVLSLGDVADLDFGELLDYRAMDARTQSILLYIEGVSRPRAFMSGLRAAARVKPVIVMKSGRHAPGARAAMSHTAALIGADHVFDAALQRAGAVRVDTIGELFSAAEILSGGSTMTGDSLALITNAGGAGVIAADCAAGHGIPLAELGAGTIARLSAALPAHWSHGNPVDVLGDATGERYRAAIEACAADENVDAMLVMLTPQSMTDPAGAASEVIAARNRSGKPVIACWMGGTHVEGAHEIFGAAGLPSFETPESAVAAFSHLVSYRRNQKLLLEVPGPLSDPTKPRIDKARRLISRWLAADRTRLTAGEAREILAAFHIPVLASKEVRSPAAAARAAQDIGFPVALKISSPELSHKSDVGGVILGLRDAGDVQKACAAMARRIRRDHPDVRLRGFSLEPMFQPRHARELFVGVVSDPVFGPVISFGAGGVAVEVLRDQAAALPPLNETLIRSMISQTRVARLLEPFRGMPGVDVQALTNVLLRVSEMVCELPEIVELDINPLVAHEGGVIALDARMRLERPQAARGRYGHMTICPYPQHLEREERLRDGSRVTIRPIRPEDARMEQLFVRGLSEEARYLRFMQALDELTPEMLARFTQIDYDREMAFVATTGHGSEQIETGVARYVINAGDTSCEFAIVVADAWRGRGLATALMHALMTEARGKSITRIESEVLSTNTSMLRLAKRLGFKTSPHKDDPAITRISKKL